MPPKLVPEGDEIHLDEDVLGETGDLHAGPGGAGRGEEPGVDLIHRREVPEVLLGGDHAKIARWRRKESVRRTLLRRPDLLVKATLSKQDRLLLAEVRREEGMPEDESASTDRSSGHSGKDTRKTGRAAKRKG